MAWKKKLWEAQTAVKRPHIPSFDLYGLQHYLEEMSRDGLHFSGFGKNGKMVFDKGEACSKHYLAVIISEITAKSTGEFLSRCEADGLYFIDRLDSRDLFVFTCDDPEQGRALLGGLGKRRGKINLLCYGALLLLTLLLCAAAGWLYYDRSIRMAYHDALRFYSHDFNIIGTKLLAAAALCLLCAIGITFLFCILCRKRAVAVQVWRTVSWVGVAGAVLLCGSGLSGIWGGLRHAYNDYTQPEVPASAYTIDFSGGADQTRALTFEGLGLSCALSDHYRLVWTGEEIDRAAGTYVEKSFVTETMECSSERIAQNLYRRFRLDEDAEWTELSATQSHAMAVEEGKYAKKDQRWYLLLRRGEVVYYAQLYNLYCNETVEQSITQLVKNKTNGSTALSEQATTDLAAVSE